MHKIPEDVNSYKYRVIAKEIKVYQRKAHDMDTLVNALKDIVTIIHKLRQIDHRLTQELESVQKDFCKHWADSVRDRDIMEVRAGIPTQALVTMWFYQAGFQITDIEIKYKDNNDDEHSFDIEVEDQEGNTYDIDVWQATGSLVNLKYYKKQIFLLGKDVCDEKGVNNEATTTLGNAHPFGPPLCDEKGVNNEATAALLKKCELGDDSKANFCALMNKMRGLREDRTGIIVALIPDKVLSFFPLIREEWGECLHENKCVIVLRLGNGGWSEERYGTGYLVCSPKFAHVKKVKDMIGALKFECVMYEKSVR